MGLQRFHAHLIKTPLVIKACHVSLMHHILQYVKALFRLLRV